MALFRFGTSEKTPIELWLLTVNKLDWRKGQRHFSRASALRRALTLGLSPDEITNELLRRCDAIGDCRREAKIRRDITDYFRLEHCNQTAKYRPKVEVDEDLFRAITSASVLIDHLRALSPHPLSDDDPPSENS